MRNLAAAFIIMLLVGISSANASPGTKATKIQPARSVVVGGFDPDKPENLPTLLEQLDVKTEPNTIVFVDLK